MHLYIHIPFCKQACYYCDFHFSTQLNSKDLFVEALIKEIALQKDYLKEKSLETIYFGGGTPSLLSAQNFELIFNEIVKYYNLSYLKEVTLEANPDDINQANLAIWEDFGINRISLGIQTFDDAQLKFMNRAHDGAQAIKSLDLLYSNNFENISVDLIYSHLNELDHKKLISDLEILSRYNLPHISAYNLSIEDKTVFGNWRKKGKIKPASEDFSVNQFEILVETLENQGFEQYEISNFARNKNYALHNTSYWQNHEYLGLGPSAHSYNLENRQANVSNNTKYIKAITNNEQYFEIEKLTKQEKANDYLLAGLRTIWGVNLNTLSEIVGELNDDFNQKIKILESQELITKEANSIKITKKGRILSDGITSELFF